MLIIPMIRDGILTMADAAERMGISVDQLEKDF